MNSNHQKHKTNHTKETHTSKRHLSAEEIDLMVAAFEEATRDRLPDGVLGGVLRNHEADIRQEAVLIQLQWYLKQHRSIIASGAKKRHNHQCNWNYPKSAAYALKYAKLRYIDRLSIKSRYHEPLTEANGGICQQSMNLPLWKLPTAVRRAMALCGIRDAENRGQISARNAEVAKLILGGMSVVQVARQCGVTRGAIYEQLRRIGAVMPKVMEEIEVPSF